MPSFYTIAQYTPSPISDERINFGVFVFGDGKIRSHFLKNFERVRHFGAEMASLRQFMAEVDGITEESLREMVSTWAYSIRFTPVRGSLLKPGFLLKDVTKEFLIDPPIHKAKYRYRRDAADLAFRSIKAALKESVSSDAKKYLRSNLKIEGDKGTHYLDVGLQNSLTRFGARGLSFEIPDGPELSKEVNSTTFTVQDVIKTLPGVKMSIIVLPPPKESQTYKRAVGTLRDAGAAVVDEEDVGDWAKRSVNEFVSEHASNHPNKAAPSMRK